MGLFDFVVDAGAKLFAGGSDKDSKNDKDAASREGGRTMEQALADRERGTKLTELVQGLGFGKEIEIGFREGVATVSGAAASQEEREKIVLLVGNNQGVAQVDDRLKVEAPEPEAKPEATIYTVQAGDSLSKIAKQHYGDAMKYMVIFKANTPMLTDPNKIYPGQALRIPPLD